MPARAQRGLWKNADIFKMNGDDDQYLKSCSCIIIWKLFATVQPFRYQRIIVDSGKVDAYTARVIDSKRVKICQNTKG